MSKYQPIKSKSMETEKAKEVLERMSFFDIIKMLNDYIDDDMSMSKYSMFRRIDDEDWWDELADYYGAWFVINNLLSDRSNFDKNDDYFYYDGDERAFYSFSCKEQIIDFIGEPNLIEVVKIMGITNNKQPHK